MRNRRLETNSVLAALTLSPTRRFQIDVGSGFSVTATPAGDVTVYRASATVSYRLTKWLSLTAAYRFSRQDQNATHIDHNIFTLGLDAIYPIRAD